VKKQITSDQRIPVAPPQTVHGVPADDSRAGSIVARVNVGLRDNVAI